MHRNNRNTDILDSLDIYSYIRELINIPDEVPKGRVNLDKNVRHGSPVCAKAREFSSYRSICLREKTTRRYVLELLKQICKAEKENSPALPMLRGELRHETVRLADLTLRRRRLEERRDGLKGELLRTVVQYRYFENIDKRIPTWHDTAKDLGIAISGEELRRYVCAKFEEQL